MGRECGSDKLSPACNFRKRKPASTLASVLSGGVLISPPSQTRGSPLGDTSYVTCDIRASGVRHATHLMAEAANLPPIARHSLVQIRVAAFCAPSQDEL